MIRKFLFLFFIAFYLPCAFSSSFEIDFLKNYLSLHSFPSLKNYPLTGKFKISKEKKAEAVIYNFSGRDILVGKRIFKKIEFKVVRKGDTLYIPLLSLAGFFLKGNLNLKTQELKLFFSYAGEYTSSVFKGKVKTNMHLWGKVNNLSVSGSIDVRDGRYHNKDFSSLTLHFLGKPPLLKIIDSKLILGDGTVCSLSGDINLKNNNILQVTEPLVSKLVFSGWEIAKNQKEQVFLKKKVGDKFGVSFNKSEHALSTPSAELKYKLKNGKSLKLDIIDNETAVKFERKKEF